MDDRTIQKLAKAIADELRRTPLPVITASELEAKRAKDELERQQRIEERDARLAALRNAQELHRNALEDLAPGVGAAAEIGRKLAERAVGYSSLYMTGLLEPVSGTSLADPAKSWLGKLAGGFAGARPNLPPEADDEDGQSVAAS